jgi:hypothetical protein
MYFVVNALSTAHPTVYYCRTMQLIAIIQHGRRQVQATFVFMYV